MAHHIAQITPFEKFIINSDGLPTSADFREKMKKAYEAGVIFGSEEMSKLKEELLALPPHDRKCRLRELRAAARAERASLHQREGLEKRLSRITDLLACYEDLSTLVNNGLKLERASSSNLHRLRHSIYNKGFFINRDHDELDPSSAGEYDTLLSASHSFVIQHDWASAFANAEEYQDSLSFRLPFEICAFEFKVSGRAVIIIATEVDSVVFLQLAAETNGFWFSFERAVRFDESSEGKIGEPLSSLMCFLRSQIKAVSVALDAGVAEVDVIRAAHKLNRAREKSGRPPIADYNVISLAYRERVKPLPDRQKTGAHHRLHFRRGHWRHFETFKTWVRWTLVGDPNLGFVDKEYRL